MAKNLSLSLLLSHLFEYEKNDVINVYLIIACHLDCVGKFYQDWNIFLESFAELEFCIHGNASSSVTMASSSHKMPDPTPTVPASTTPSTSDFSSGSAIASSRMRYIAEYNCCMWGCETYFMIKI